MTNDEIDAFILDRLPTDTFVLLRSLDPPVRGTRLANVARRLRARGLIEGQPLRTGTHSKMWRRVECRDDLLERVLAEASLRFSVHRRDIVGRYQFRFVTQARQAVWLALKRCGISVSQIGRWFARNHATVIDGCCRAQYRYDRDPVYAAIVRDIEDLHPARRREKERLQAAIASGNVGESATQEVAL